MKVSAFSIVKNESQFIGYGALSILPYVDELIYADGDSTDGTLELLQYIKDKYDKMGRIKILRGMDCKNLKEDYVRLFNDVIKQCKGSYVWYCHPDMIIRRCRAIDEIGKYFAYYVNMRSFADDGSTEIIKGRKDKWKTIMKNDFGLTYWGFYGDENEDMYFSEITGNEHKVYNDCKFYPYIVGDLGIDIEHYCECKPKDRRLEKMSKVMKTNYKLSDEEIRLLSSNHPRVTLTSENGQFGDFEFQQRKDAMPEIFEKYEKEFDSVLGR